MYIIQYHTIVLLLLSAHPGKEFRLQNLHQIFCTIFLKRPSLHEQSVYVFDYFIAVSNYIL